MFPSFFPAEHFLDRHHYPRLGEEALAVKETAVASLLTIVILAPLRTRPGHHPTREGQIAPGLWKDMTFIARGHYLDPDHHVDPGQSRQNPGQRLHRGGGDSYVLVALDVVDAVVLVTVVTTTAATVIGVELQAEIGALIDTVRLDDE